MDESAAITELSGVIRAGGLVASGSGGVTLISGGADSAALAAGLAASCGPRRIVALHLDYGLRDDSALDAAACAEICDRTGVELVVRRPAAGSLEGNVQAWARDQRYRTAEELRAERGLDWIATGHTRTDLAETVIYRLAASPGTRALLGLPARRGRIVRPLLGLGRERVRALAAALDLPFRDDPTNAEPSYARNRVRGEVMPVLSELNPAAERNIAATGEELRSDDELLERLAALAVEGSLRRGTLPAETLLSLDEPIARRALRLVAERTTGRTVPVGRSVAAEVMRLATDPEGGVVELGGGAEVRIEHGTIGFFESGVPDRDHPPAELPIGGSCRFGPWTVRAEECEASLGGSGVVLDRGSLTPPLTVRSWRDGDRMRPLGLGGAKSLQDLFTDRRVPRSRRRELPIVLSGERIAWVAGVEIGDEFRLRPGSSAGVRLTAEPARN